MLDWQKNQCYEKIWVDDDVDDLGISCYFLGRIGFRPASSANSLNPSPNSRKALWLFLRNFGINCLDNFFIATANCCPSHLDLLLTISQQPLFIAVISKLQPSVVCSEPIFPMFRRVMRSWGRDNASYELIHSLVNSLTASLTISLNLRWVFLQLGEEVPYLR